MKQMLIFVAVMAVLAVCAVQGFGCNCILPQPSEPLRLQVNHARRGSRAIFSGTVVKIDRTLSFVAATFKVDAIWKGVLPKMLVVTTGTDDCGYRFQLGERYLVYAVPWPNATAFYTSICQRTALFSRATTDLQVLGKPRRSVT